MREKEIEKLFIQKVREYGGRAYKFVSPGNSGVPDRLVVLPDGRIGFVELKAPGRKPSQEQVFQLKRLEDLGCYVTVIDKPDMIDQVIREIAEYPMDEVVFDKPKAGGRA